jgi:hypothetical protein
VPLEGFCDNYTHCPVDQFCDDDHTCKGPTRPAPSFLDPVTAQAVTFEFRGVINNRDDVFGPGPTLGIAAYEWHYDEGAETLSDYGYAYRWIIPQNYPDETLRGREMIVMGASRAFSGSMGGVEYNHISIGFPASGFVEMKDQGGNEAALSDPMWFRMYNIVSVVREWDQSVFKRTCTLSEFDPANPDSRLFLNHFDNATFEEGEDLLLWGNVAMTTKLEITPSNEETLCAFYQNDVSISRQEYLDGIALTEPALACEVEEGFFDPNTIRLATFFFIGTINDPDVGFSNFLTGAGDLTVSLDGNEVEADDYYALAYKYTSSPTDLMVYQTLGSVEILGENEYTYNLFRLTIDPAILAQMKQQSLVSVPYDPQTMFAVLEHSHFKGQGNDAWYKVCPIAVSDPDATTGALMACYDHNVEFACNERLELAGNLDMTDDATTVQEVYEIADDCYCFINYSTTPVDCADFDAL